MANYQLGTTDPISDPQLDLFPNHLHSTHLDLLAMRKRIKNDLRMWQEKLVMIEEEIKNVEDR